MAESDPVNTANEFALSAGQNLPNHTALGGRRAKFVRPIQHPLFRTRQSAYRFIGWLEAMAETLPDEDNPTSLEDVRAAIRNT